VLLFILRIFLPLSFGYYLSYFYRTVNAVIAPDLTADLGLSPADLGWVGSAYFASFALFQIPLGILLDRVEIRKISASLLIIAGIGAAVFASADSVMQLWLGRFIIGLGVSACLMGAFKAYVIWMPVQRLPLINGLQLAAGGIGALTATAPVEAALQFTDWRNVFSLLSAITIASALIIFFCVPKQNIEKSEQSTLKQLAGYLSIIKNPVFFAVAPISFLAQAAFISLQSLWIGQWLREALLLPRDEAAHYLLIAAGATVIGYVAMGSIASKLQRFGISSRTVSLTGLSLFLFVQIAIVLQVAIPAALLWCLFGFIGTSGSLMYATLLQYFPKHLAGRVITSLNLLLFVSIFALQWLMGVIVDLWPLTTQGHSPIEAYQWAFTLGISLQIVGFIWYLLNRKLLLSKTNS
jgi:predicted MFS family arabinose efflux permease